MTDTSADALRGFSDALRETPVRALDAATRALNDAADYAREAGAVEITRRYRLEKAYVDKHLKVDKEAKRTDLEAKVSAKRRSVLAPRYGARQALAAAAGAAGDPSRGIPSGKKGAGSTPWSVLRGGATKRWRNAFFVRLKGSGALGMVARYGSGEGLSPEQDWAQNLDVVHSTSVDQAWRDVREEVTPAAMALAQEIFLLEMERAR